MTLPTDAVGDYYDWKDTLLLHPDITPTDQIRAIIRRLDDHCLGWEIKELAEAELDVLVASNELGWKLAADSVTELRRVLTEINPSDIIWSSIHAYDAAIIKQGVK